MDMPAEAAAAAAAPAAAPATEVLSFGASDDQQIFQIVKGYPRAGHLKISTAGMAFKEKKTGKKTQIHKPDMVSLRWARVGRGHQLQVGVKGAELWFDGLRPTQKDHMNDFFDRAFPDIPIETEDVSVTGWNWGDYDASASALKFVVNDKCSFEIPFAAIEKAQSASKHETSIEFVPIDDDKTVQAVESMRFHFTAHPDDAEREITRPEELKELIMKRVDTAESGGLAIATFSDVMCMNPRAKYDFTFFPSYVHLHGKSAAFKIPYANIKRLFLLGAHDHVKKYLVWTVDPPVKNNLKKYHILPFQFDTGHEIEVDIAKPDVDDVPHKLAELASQESGDLVEVVARLVKLLSKAKLLNAGRFRSAAGSECVKASYKLVHDGFLYPMEKAFLFIFKFPQYIRYEEVSAVSFERVKKSESLARSFDLEVSRKDGETIKFTSIPKPEFERLKEFFKEKKLNITSVDDEDDIDPLAAYADESDDDEYGRRMKREGGARGGDEEDSEEDGDYEMGEESSVDEEYGSDASEEEGAAAKQRKRKRRGPDDSDDADDSDAEEEDASPKKAKKLKKKKDPNAPKKNLSAYTMFASSVREEVKEANPDADFATQSRLIAAKWKGLSDEDKAPWEEKAQESKNQYDIALARYYEENPEALKEFGPSKAKKQKRNGPKKPLSAYMYFQAASRESVKEDNPDAKPTEMLSLLAEKWKTLGPEDKSEFDALAAKDKERYATEVEEDRKARIARGEIIEKPKRKSKKGGDPNAPKKPMGAYFLFCNEVREATKAANPEASTTELSKLFSAKWGAMSAEEKTPYHDKNQEHKAQYAIDLEKYYEENPEARQAMEAAKASKPKRAKGDSQIKGQAKLSFKSADVLHSSDDIDSDNLEEIEAMLANAKET